MSTGTFADQVLGLARSYKKTIRSIERGCERLGKDPYYATETYKDEFRKDLVKALSRDSYFRRVDIDKFCEGLEDLFMTSTPEYKYRP